jgi:hypothetical protein
MFPFAAKMVILLLLLFICQLHFVGFLFAIDSQNDYVFLTLCIVLLINLLQEFSASGANATSFTTFHQLKMTH